MIRIIVKWRKGHHHSKTWDIWTNNMLFVVFVNTIILYLIMFFVTLVGHLGFRLLYLLPSEGLYICILYYNNN